MCLGWTLAYSAGYCEETPLTTLASLRNLVCRTWEGPDQIPAVWIHSTVLIRLNYCTIQLSLTAGEVEP